MRPFGKKKQKAETPVAEPHPRFVDKEGYISLLPPREVKAEPVDPETQRLINWRQSYDQMRQTAFEIKTGCGKCIEGQVQYGPGPDDHAICNCKLGNPDSIVNQQSKPAEGGKK